MASSGIEAWDRALSNVDEDDWCSEEYNGNWGSLLSDMDIYLYSNSQGSMEEVADQLRDWASNSSNQTTLKQEITTVVNKLTTITGE